MIVSVIGSPGLAPKLGKKGTVSDVTIYNFKDSESEFSFIEPTLYPEKLASLLTAVEMGEVILLKIDENFLDIKLGETLLAVDYLQKNKGIIVLENVVFEQVEPLLKNNIAKNYKVVENDLIKIKQALNSFSLDEKQFPNSIIIDHSFQVKSVGNVILGKVLSGTIKKYEKLKLYPGNKEVAIKSIQRFDVDVEKAGCNERLGAGVKGAEIEELQRGFILSDVEQLFGKQISVQFNQSPFFRFDVPKNPIMFTGLQYLPVEFDGKIIKSEKEFVYSKSQRFLLCDPSRKPRICGYGTVL